MSWIPHHLRFINIFMQFPFWILLTLPDPGLNIPEILLQNLMLNLPRGAWKCESTGTQKTDWCPGMAMTGEWLIVWTKREVQGFFCSLTFSMQFPLCFLVKWMEEKHTSLSPPFRSVCKSDNGKVYFLIVPHMCCSSKYQGLHLNLV